MLQGVHERKINIPIEGATGATPLITGDADSWILVHELIGSMDGDGTLTISAGSRELAVFELAAGQGITLTDEPGEDGRPRFECYPGEDFIIDPGGNTFIGNVHYSRNH